MSGVGPKRVAAESANVNENDRRHRFGIALLFVASVLLFGPVALGLPGEQVVGAVAVLGLAAGAYLVGTAGDGRPV